MQREYFVLNWNADESNTINIYGSDKSSGIMYVPEGENITYMSAQYQGKSAYFKLKDESCTPDLAVLRGIWQADSADTLSADSADYYILSVSDRTFGSIYNSGTCELSGTDTLSFADRNGNHLFDSEYINYKLVLKDGDITAAFYGIIIN